MDKMWKISGKLKGKTRAARRRQYSQLSPEADDQPEPGFAARMISRVKGAKLGGKSRNGARDPNSALLEEERRPSLWGKVRDAYKGMMPKTAGEASGTSVASVGKTRGTQFCQKAEIEFIETNIGFKLNKMELAYLDHLRRTLDSRYA